jgi:hypothetical protein
MEIGAFCDTPCRFMLITKLLTCVSRGNDERSIALRISSLNHVESSCVVLCKRENLYPVDEKYMI